MKRNTILIMCNYILLIALALHQDYSNVYPETGIVTKVETLSETETLLTITVANGNLFRCMTEDVDWYIDDFISMLIDSKGTVEVEDDEIIDIKYAGIIEHFRKEIP